jgi:CheY-like chemotaxis protein
MEKTYRIGIIMPHRTVNFLVVEDDEVDIKALKRAFKELRLCNPIRFARDGIEALEILRGENGQEKLAKPYLVLLDLNMPRMNGIEFLDEVREDPEHHSAIVFVMTTSSAEEDRIKAYDKNVAGYMLKSNAGDTFNKALSMLEHYWRVVEFPK